MAPRKPNPERYYVRTANEVARILTLVVQQLAKVRRRQGRAQPGADGDLVAQLRPLLPSAVEALGKLAKTKRNLDARVAIQVSEDIGR